MTDDAKLRIIDFNSGFILSTASVIDIQQLGI